MGQDRVTPSLRLIMAISADGFIARGPDDSMNWLGQTDKGIFKLLTTQESPSVLIRSRRTELAMPSVLAGRTFVTVSRRGIMTLDDAAKAYPSAWLVGGQELAIEGIKNGHVRSAFLCISARYCFDGIQSKLKETLLANGLKLILETQINDVRVHRYG